MKKFMMTLFAMLTIAASANAMSYEQARQEALFLTDKMAYELNLTDAQYEAAYEINLDYLMGVTGRGDVFGTYWERRNLDLGYILYSWQWDAFCAASYFYRPLYWDAGFWHFGIYARYPRRDYFYFGTPHFYVSYRGGHSWHYNGGHSYYERHRDHFRPSHGSRDNHVGMRDGWNRGDYRSQGNSSTRVTGGTRRTNGDNVRGNADSRRGNGDNVRDNADTRRGSGDNVRGNASSGPRSQGSGYTRTTTGSRSTSSQYGESRQSAGSRSLPATPQRSTQQSVGTSSVRSTGSVSRSSGSSVRSHSSAGSHSSSMRSSGSSHSSGASRSSGSSRR